MDDRWVTRAARVTRVVRPENNARSEGLAMTLNWRRRCWYLVASGLGGVVLAVWAGVTCIRVDRDRCSRPPLDSTIRTDVETTAPGTMRPLGSDGLMVDKNGTIWRGRQPLGVWGVNGGEAADAAKLR